MYQQPIQAQQTWSGVQYVQGTMPTLYTYSSVPVVTTMAGVPTMEVSHQSFVPPAPSGVNLLQWQNGMWVYTASAEDANSVQAYDPQAPPNVAGWNIPATWGVTPQYYYPQATQVQVQKQQKQPEQSYWDTKLGDNGLGLENMHIKQKPGLTAAGEGGDKIPHTPWTWAPRELDDNSQSRQAGNAAQYQNAQQPQRPKQVEPSGRSDGTTGYTAAGGTHYSGSGSGRHGHRYTVPSHAYSSVPAGQQQQQYVVYYISG